MSIAFNAGFANNPNDTLGRKAVSAKTTGSSFRDYLATPGATAPEKPSPAIDSVANKAAEFDPFDPFSVVRSGAVPEDNAFVQALKRLYGLVVDPSPVPQIPGAITLGASPLQIENVQVKQASMDLPPTTDSSPGPITGLSQLISNAVEQSAATTVNQEVMDTVLNRLS